jgi:hypothetical protein
MALSIDAAKKLTPDSALEGDEFHLYFEQILGVRSTGRIEPVGSHLQM